MAHGPSCSVACGIFPDQGSNPCLLHWQADSQPLCHQGSPIACFLDWQAERGLRKVESDEQGQLRGEWIIKKIDSLHESKRNSI